MRGEWCYFASHFTAAQCDAILARGAARAQTPTTVGAGSHQRTNDTVRRGTLAWLPRADGFEDVCNELWVLAGRANRDWFGFHIDPVDAVQMSTYATGDYYGPHIDIFYDSPDRHRKLSCVVQLTAPDAYGGGDVVLHPNAHAAPLAAPVRAQGTVLFFPSFVRHEVAAVTHGTRTSLVAWFDGPALR